MESEHTKAIWKVSVPELCDYCSKCCYRRELSCYPFRQSGIHNPTKTLLAPRHLYSVSANSTPHESRQVSSEICQVSTVLQWMSKKHQRFFSSRSSIIVSVSNTHIWENQVFPPVPTFSSRENKQNCKKTYI